MFQLAARAILDAIEQNSITTTRNERTITLSINEGPILEVPITPLPVVSHGVSNSVIVTSNEITVATIDAESTSQAFEVARILKELLADPTAWSAADYFNRFSDGTAAFVEQGERIHNGIGKICGVIGLLMLLLILTAAFPGIVILTGIILLFVYVVCVNLS